MAPSILKRLLFLLYIISIAASAQVNAAVLSLDSKSLQEQRRDFLLAEKALKKKQLSQYQKLLPAIKDYPLTPYVQYRELEKRLSTLPFNDVDQFLTEHADTYLADRLRIVWLKRLAKQKKWKAYSKYFEPGFKSATLNCQYQWSRLKTGDNSALLNVPALWNVGKSQPKACDPLFKAWISAGSLTDDLAWQRHHKAIAAKKLSLAKYIGKQFSSDTYKKYAKRYREVYTNPKKILKVKEFSEQTTENKTIILYGLKRVARHNPEKAVEAWHQYSAQQLFSDSDHASTKESLATALARKGFVDEAEQLLGSGTVASEQLVERLIRLSLREEDWNKVMYWLDKLPPSLQDEERWRYWRARGLSQLDHSKHQLEINSIYSALALGRSFYGFLSADHQSSDYQLLDTPANIPVEMVDNISTMPAILRVKELLTLDRRHYARKEWYYATKNFDKAHLKAAGIVAERFGWHRQGIQAMAGARYWDDLQVRFPLAFQKQFDAVSSTMKLDPQTLFAIARQESAFSPDAKSPVGAMGLMQLMPGTAKDTAKKIGLTYRKSDLFTPAINIKLGGSYFSQLMGRFQDNRILSAAAYNAGPHRVKRWLSKEDKSIPYDIWIETIPFNETRRYVQNILAYSVIYSYRMGEKTPLIRKHEASQML